MQYSSIERVAETRLPTRWGVFQTIGFRGHYPAGAKPGPMGQTSDEVVALLFGDVRFGEPIVRLHSACLTGDVFSSTRCDCGMQLKIALRTIANAGAGIVLYEEQEGRGIGLMSKLRAYQLQDQGLDTVEANLKLGFEADHRDFMLSVEILQQLGIRAIRLMTNNPRKIRAFASRGINVVERISIETPPEVTNRKYLSVKKEKLGHLIGQEYLL